MRTLAPTSQRTHRRNHILHYCYALLIALAMICLCTTATLHAQGSAMRVETFMLNPGGEVRVENSRGSTRIQSYDDASVRIVAEKKSPAGSSLDPSELMLMRVQNTVIVQCKHSASMGRIDLTIYMPRDARFQLAGGALPVEMSGSFRGAVVDTTGGSISYRVPSNDDAQIAMRTERGIVKSTAPLVVIERTGTQSLQGRLGSGAAQIFLSSQSGNISLTAGPPNSGVVARSNVPAQEQNNRGAQDQDDAGSYQTRSSEPSYQRGNSSPSYRPSSLPGANQPANPSQPSGGASNQQGNNSVIFAGGDRSDDAELSVRGIGPLNRPRQEQRTQSGNSGLRVRIIPSTAPLGRESSGSSIYDRPDPDQNSQAADPYAPGGQPRPNATRGNQSSRSNNDQQYDPYNPAARPSTDKAPDFDREPMATSRRTDRPPTLRSSTIEDSSPDRPSGAADAGEKDDETIVLKNALVNLNVLVANRSGVAMANLKKEDFTIYENGEAQKIEFFAPGTAPFNLVLVLDLSGSIKDKLEVVKSAALRFIDVVGPQDKIAVVTFTQDVRVVSQLTSNRDELKRRIKAIERPEGGTAFYEAMWFSIIDTLRGTGGQRNAVVVLTDGVDSSLDRYNPAPSRVSFGRLAQRIEESDVVIFPIYMDTEYEEVFERGNATSESYAIARDQLARLAELSGGQMFKAEKVNDLSGIYKQVAAAIKTVYSVGYYPANPDRDGTFRRVRVTVDRPDASVKTRKGYYAK